MANGEVFFSDLPLDITISSTGDIAPVVNKESIKQSLRMLINTARTTRVFLPDYGARIRGFLFEPFDLSTANRLGQEIRETIQNYEKRITLIDINVIMGTDEKSYDVNVSYQITNTNITDNVLITLERL